MCQLNLTSTLVTHTFWWRKVLKPEGEEQDPVPVCSAPPDGSRGTGTAHSDMARGWGWGLQGGHG